MKCITVSALVFFALGLMVPGAFAENIPIRAALEGARFRESPRFTRRFGGVRTSNTDLTGCLVYESDSNIRRWWNNLVAASDSSASGAAGSRS